MKGIFVKIYWNTRPDGSWITEEEADEIDWDAMDAPVSIYGPFEDMSAANDWMINDYPDDDTDVNDMVADDYDIPDGWYVNDPKSIFPDEPEEDLTIHYRDTPG